MPNNVQKAFAISDARIMYVSLVDKAANQKQFLITKSADGKADFQTFGRIVKSDANTHYVTGIVYEPMVEDSHGNYMTAEEVEKAAYWFAKNGNGADLQHNFEPLENATVVESWIAKADFDIGGEAVKKGTWLMTMEITDPSLFESIEKGEITGFSMGGSGLYSETDVDISDPEHPVAKSEARGLLKRLGDMLGIGSIEKGQVRDRYLRDITRDNFWTAFYALSNYLLESYNKETGEWEVVTDEETIREALSDFNEIVTGLLTGSQPIVKTLNAAPVEKAGKALSSANRETLKSIHDRLGEFLAKFNDEEEIEMSANELEKIVADAITKAMATNTQNATGTPQTSEGEVSTTAGVQKDANGSGAAETAITQEAVEKMVADAVQKALAPAQPQVTLENLNQYIEAAVAKAMEPVLKSTGLPTNLNDEGDANVQKSGQEHYLHGIL